MTTTDPRPTEQAAARTGSWVLAATILGSSMAFIDGTVVNVALPALQTGLHATVSDVQWVVESYALLLAALLLVGGSLGDLYGRRRLYLIGVTVFAASSAWCGFAGSVKMLIFARGLQGVGAALLVPGSLSLITAAFPPEKRGTAIGTWSGSTAATAAVGPVIGGWLVEHASWRWAFLLNLPIAIAALLITIKYVPESRDETRSRDLDWAGALLATVGLGGVTYALIEAMNSRSGSITAGSLGVAALVGFFVVEGKSRAPMVSLRLFRSRNFTGANLITLFLYAALSGMMFFYPLDLIQIQHYTATEAGAALLPLITLMFLLSRWSGGLVARYGAKWPLTIGPTIVAIGMAIAVIPSIGGSYWVTFFPSIVLIGLGMSFSVAPLTTTVMDAVPESGAGVASGVNNAMSRLASLLAVAVLGLVLIRSFNNSLDRRLAGMQLPPQARQLIDSQRPKLAAASNPDPRVQKAIALAFVDGYRIVLWVSAGLAMAAALSAWFCLTTAKDAGDKEDSPGDY